MADQDVVRSRRAVMAAAAAAATASIVGSLARPAIAEAAAGSFDSASGTPALTATTSFPDGTGVWATHTPSSGLGGGVYGETSSVTGIGVAGRNKGGGTAIYADGSIGVQADTFDAAGSGVIGTNKSDTGVAIGVAGKSNSSTGIGVWGEATSVGSQENYGVFGLSHSSLGRAVFGWNVSLQGGAGVWGQTNAATGAAVRGYAWDGDGASGTFGTGVIGTSGSHAFPPPAPRANTGVMGLSPTGTGGYFESGTGTALQAKGKVRFSRSGKASVAAGSSYVDVPVSGGLSGTPLCFANLGTYRSGVHVAAVTPNPTSGKIRIRLNKVASTSSATTVFWHVLA